MFCRLLVDDMPPVDSQLLPPKPSRTKHCSVHETDIAVHLFTHFGLQVNFFLIHKILNFS